MRAKNKKVLLIYFYYTIMSSAYLHGVMVFTARLTKYYFSNALCWRMRFFNKIHGRCIAEPLFLLILVLLSVMTLTAYFGINKTKVLVQSLG